MLDERPARSTTYLEIDKEPEVKSEWEDDPQVEVKKTKKKQEKKEKPKGEKHAKPKTLF